MSCCGPTICITTPTRNVLVTTTVTQAVTIATVGPQGPPGATGSPGATGAPGAAATIVVGTVTTGAPGSSATVTNVGTSGAAIFDFSIPKGDPNTGYVFTQSTPATTWTINHNLGFRPSVEILDSGSQEIDGEVSHPTVNQTVVTLNPATAGLARLT